MPINEIPFGILDGRYINAAGDAMTGRFAYNLVTFTDGDATPDVSAGNSCLSANTSQTVITQFDGGYAGQILHLQFGDAFTRIEHGTNIRLRGGLDYPAPGALSVAYDTLVLSTVDGTIFAEETRSRNSS